MKPGLLPTLLLLVATAIPATAAATVADRRTPVVVAVENVGPSVVNINTSQVETVSPFRRGIDPFGGGPFGPRRVERRSLGSGVVITPDGYILTNSHVVDGATAIRVTLADDREFEAEVVGADPRSDIAVIKITADAPLPVAPVGTSSDLMVGETVIAIGNPFGLAHTVTTGVLSAANRDIATEEGILLQDFIQVDAPINPGSSGGALLNIDGQLIGVTSAIRRGAEGIGFAVPIDKAMRIVRELIAKGEVAVGWAGFVADDLTPGLRRQLGYEGKEGALVAKVFDDGPAHAAGIRPGDVVTAYDGKKIENRRDLAARIAAAPADARPTLTVHRFGEVMRITVSIAPVTPALADNAARRWLGVEVAPVDRKQVALYRLRTDRGMVVTAVDEGVGLGESGVRPGDVVRRIGRTDTDTRDDYRKGVMDGIGRGGSVVYVQRGTAVYQLTVGR